MLGAAVATIAGLAPATATAAEQAPSGLVAVPSQDTRARTAAAVSSDEDKIAAAGLLGINPGPELMVLSDRDFVVAMYRIADDQDRPHPLKPGNRTVKSAALKALEEGDAACTTFIKTGMRVARDEDIRLELDWSAQDRAERVAKATAAGLFPVPAGNPELAKSVFDFIAYLLLNTHPQKDRLVQEKGEEALRGTADDQWTFLVSGIGAAHRADVVRGIQERADQKEEDKLRDLARAAKEHAAMQALGIVADKNMVNLPDQFFVFEISNRAAQDSEVFAAAENALNSGDPAEWKLFIDKGAEAAKLRDMTKTLRKRDEGRSRQILEIRTRAANGLAHPALVAAADRALGGSVNDRTKFLAGGKDEHLDQSVRTLDLDDFYLADNRQAPVKPWAPGQLPELKWKIEPGLADPSCHSFASTTRPNHYVRIVDNRISVDPTDGSNAFYASVTWCARKSGSGIAFRNPQAQADLGITLPNGRSTTWSVEAPQPPMPIERRYQYDGGARSKLGTPLSDAVLKDNGEGYREYQFGRLYQAFRQSTGNLTTSVLTAEVLRKYEALGHENGVLGYPVEDELTFGKGLGRAQRFAKGAVYVIRNTSTFALHGDIYRRYAETGAENGPLGHPTSEVTSLPDNVGTVVTFANNNSAIYSHPGSGTRIVQGAVRTKWTELGAERSWLGYPTSDTFALPRGTRGQFQNGRVDTSTDGGVTTAYRTVQVTQPAVEIKGVGSNKCVQVAGVGQDALRDSAGIELWECVAGVKQIWDLTPVGGHRYLLKNRNSGKCLDVLGVSLENQAALIQSTCHSGQNQQWEFTTETVGGPLSLRAVHSGKVIEAKAKGTANATLVEQTADKGEPHQRWTLVPM